MRLALAAVVALGVASCVFLLLQLAPGDPVEALLGERAAPAERTALRAALGLDLPLTTQWVEFLQRLLQGDLGTSLVSRQPVAALVSERLPHTAWLAVAAIGVALAIALPLGMWSALREGSAWDNATLFVAVLGQSLPGFVLGPLLMLVFAVWLGWLPVAGGGFPEGLVLPALTLGLALAALLTRMVRATVRDTLAEEFVRAARARGLPERRVLWRHALGNAALPLLTTVGQQCGALLGGAVITEMVFGWPGLGQLLIEAIQQRDYPVAQGCVLVVALTHLLLNLLVDLLCGVLDPRVDAL